MAGSGPRRQQTIRYGTAGGAWGLERWARSHRGPSWPDLHPLPRRVVPAIPNPLAQGPRAVHDAGRHAAAALSIRRRGSRLASGVSCRPSATPSQAEPYGLPSRHANGATIATPGGQTRSAGGSSVTVPPRAEAPRRSTRIGPDRRAGAPARRTRSASGEISLARADHRDGRWTGWSVLPRLPGARRRERQDQAECT